MYNDKLVYKLAIWAFLGISGWNEKEALDQSGSSIIIVYIYVYPPQYSMHTTIF